MTLTLFYSFLAGFSELFGLLPSQVWDVLDKASEMNSPIFSTAVCAGALNGVILFLLSQKFKFKDYLPLILYGFLGVLALYLLEAANIRIGLRTGGFVLLAFVAGLYLQNSSFAPLLQNKKVWALAAVLMAFPYVPVGLCLLSVVAFEYKESRKVLRNWVALQIPMLLWVIIRHGMNINLVTKASGVEISFAYLLSCIGSFLGLTLILKLILNKKQDWLKQVLTGVGCLILYLTSRYGDVTVHEQLYAIQFPSMGTACEVTVWHESKSTAQGALQDAKKLFDQIEGTLSTYKSDSEITALNQKAHEQPHNCGQILWQNLMIAEAGWKASNGAFDVTIGPLVKLWGIKRKRKELPTQKEIAEAKELVGFDKLIIDYEQRTVKLPKEGFKIDFGGLTKGWAVDQVRDLLYSQGITKGLINLGGNIYCLKEPAPKKIYYKIGIKNPLKPSELSMKLPLLGQGVATSGNYEQFIMINGKRYTHIIDPRSGMPVDHADGVTVISGSATWCDVLSTAFFIEGEKLIEKIRSENPGVNVWFVKKDQMTKKVHSKTFGAVWGE